MSYPLGGKYHIPHGESNYALFTGVFKTYTSLNPDGEIKIINSLIAEIFTMRYWKCIWRIRDIIKWFN